MNNAEDVLIILPVGNTVLFPGVVLPIAIAGNSALAAAQEAVRTQRRVGLVLQKDTEAAERTPTVQTAPRKEPKPCTASVRPPPSCDSSRRRTERII